jgi:hypothetical protein
MPHRSRVTANVPPWRGYCVPDPDDGSRATFWWVDAAGALHRWPPGTRWEPDPPRFEGPDRVDQRDGWYEDVYWPWKRAVAEAIEANPESAAVRFAVRYPAAEFPSPRASLSRAETGREQQRRRYEEVTAAARARRGASVRQVAGQLGVAWATARARIAAGSGSSPRTLMLPGAPSWTT